MWILLDPRIFNYVLMVLYAANLVRWAIQRSWSDAFYWTGALIINAAITWRVR